MSPAKSHSVNSIKLRWRVPVSSGFTITAWKPLFACLLAVALPQFQSVSTEVLSSSAIQLSWHLPEQDCFNLTLVTVSCQHAVKVKDNRTEATRRTAVHSSLTTLATVTGLIPETFYNCSIASNLTESMAGQLAVQIRVYAPELAATYPECEENWCIAH